MKNKHYDIIMAWANGETIEVYLSDKQIWYTLSSPSWFDSAEYRIKPTPTPDVVREVLLVNSLSAGPLLYAASLLECNCVLVFDGDTGKLKACTFKEPQKPLGAV
jgi:hypothetical protein